ncbi:TPA: hypothetical protein RZD99_001227 [Mannheimia haemolytica]|nr:hypothetical protein [Mannheimia haemolytica]
MTDAKLFINNHIFNKGIKLIVLFNNKQEILVSSENNKKGKTALFYPNYQYLSFKQAVIFSRFFAKFEEKTTACLVMSRT